MKYLKYIIPILFVSSFAHAGTPMDSTSVNIGIGKIFDISGNIKRLIVAPGQEAQVRSDLGVAALNNNRVLFVDGVQHSVTGTTTETLVYSQTIPGGTIGINGALEVYSIVSKAGTTTAYLSVVTMKLGDALIDYTWLNSAAPYQRQRYNTLINRGSTTSQINYRTNEIISFNETAAAMEIPTSINTAVDQTFTVKISNNNVNSICSLESIIIKVVNP